ncbi:hypothetical protein M426DRAFT_15068 [Hypoxylon sp. CI-4A]|nr:hypothetical protein M426DRAFT_15068 [Hypoxylon sp. CI-4A]
MTSRASTSRAPSNPAIARSPIRRAHSSRNSTRAARAAVAERGVRMLLEPGDAALRQIPGVPLATSVSEIIPSPTDMEIFPLLTGDHESSDDVSDDVMLPLEGNTDEDATTRALHYLQDRHARYSRYMREHASLFPRTRDTYASRGSDFERHEGDPYGDALARLETRNSRTIRHHRAALRDMRAARDNQSHSSRPDLDLSPPGENDYGYLVGAPESSWIRNRDAADTQDPRQDDTAEAPATSRERSNRSRSGLSRSEERDDRQRTTDSYSYSFDRHPRARPSHSLLSRSRRHRTYRRHRESPSTGERRWEMDGLGDRDRSLSPGGWNTLLSTLTPDPQPPSFGSSFASTTTTSTVASQNPTASSSRTSVTSPIDDNEPPCDPVTDPEWSGTTLFNVSPTDINTEPLISGIERIRNSTRLPTPPGRRSYAEVANAGAGPYNDDRELLSGMRDIIQLLASREDIPSEWWAAAGLSRSTMQGTRVLSWSVLKLSRNGNLKLSLGA